MTSDAAAAAALANYRALVAKVDEKVAAVMAKHPHQFACRQGCHACCAPGLTVNAVEAAVLGEFVAARPGLAGVVGQLIRDDPHRGRRCALLTADGSCSVYDARPIVCRSHGLPLAVATEGKERRDVCPLNFAGQDLAELPAGDLINLETLNTLLSLIDRQFMAGSGGTPDAKTTRSSLAAAALAAVKVQ